MMFGKEIVIYYKPAMLFSAFIKWSRKKETTWVLKRNTFHCGYRDRTVDSTFSVALHMQHETCVALFSFSKELMRVQISKKRDRWDNRKFILHDPAKVHWIFFFTITACCMLSLHPLVFTVILCTMSRKYKVKQGGRTKGRLKTRSIASTLRTKYLHFYWQLEANTC